MGRRTPLILADEKPKKSGKISVRLRLSASCYNYSTEVSGGQLSEN